MLCVTYHYCLCIAQQFTIQMRCYETWGSQDFKNTTRVILRWGIDNILEMIYWGIDEKHDLYLSKPPGKTITYPIKMPLFFQFCGYVSTLLDGICFFNKQLPGMKIPPLQWWDIISRRRQKKLRIFSQRWRTCLVAGHHRRPGGPFGVWSWKTLWEGSGIFKWNPFWVYQTWCKYMVDLEGFPHFLVHC